VIHANVITYNEEDFIWLAMRSVVDLVDGYYVIDGRHKGFSEGSPVPSTDRTLEIVQRFRNVRVEVLTEAKLECEKRNMFRDSLADWNVIVDSHSVWMGDLRRLKYELENSKGFRTVDVGCFASTKAFLDNVMIYWTFIWHKDSGFHFGSHHWMHLGKDDSCTEGKGRRIDYVKILYLSDLLSVDRRKLKDAYMLYRSANPSEAW
jgi:hypothetical protein